MRFKFSFIGLVVGCLAAPLAWSHAQYRPFSINRYTVISFGDSEVLIDYSITVGDLPAQKLRKRADQDKDGRLSPKESEPLKRWMRSLVQSGLALHLDAGRVGPEIKQEAVELISDRIEMFAPMRFAYQFRIPCPRGRHELVFDDRTRMPMLEQTELFVRTHKGMHLFAMYGTKNTRRLERRVYWERGELPGPISIRFSLTGQSPEETEPAQSRLIDDSGPLKRALADRQLGFFGMLAALGLALLLGALHALSPGHGKALVATYLVGAKGKMRHAVILSLIVTFTHIFSVVILGLIALWATEKILPERLAPWLAFAAGVVVLALGIWMLVSRLRKKHDHHHHNDHAQTIRWGELLVLGISGGMVPCVSATVVLLFAIYLGRILFGLGLIGAFSLGLSVTLMILGILVVRGRKLLTRFAAGRARKLVAVLPVLSALAVTVLGVVMVVISIDGL